MNKVRNALADDLWVVLFDIIAVNAACVLAFLFCFYANGQVPTVEGLTAGGWGGFSLFYTVVSLLIFYAFRLYGGIWRYAGLDDMNRIILANLCTVLAQLAGTGIFIRLMPGAYYALDAVLQFLMIVMIRFSYRILIVERKIITKPERVACVVVGSGNLCRRVIRHLEADTPYQPVAVFSSREGDRSIDGIPVLPLENMEEEVARRRIWAVFVADKELSNEERERVRLAAGDGVITDFTGVMLNLSGAVSAASLLSMSSGSVKIILDGEEKAYDSGRRALADLHDTYRVASISGAIIELKKNTDNDMDQWLKDYRESTGEDVSFF